MKLRNIALILILVGCSEQTEEQMIPQDNTSPGSPQVCLGERCYTVEIADTNAKRQLGLMNRGRLDSDSGMLFVFEKEEIHTFWMKNTLIPLDMIWIDSDLRIVDIKEAEPCRADPCPVYEPTGKALYVLEVNKGEAERIGFSIRDLVLFRNID